jgi:hypothetical protein
MIEVELVTNSNEHEYKEFVDHCSSALVNHSLEWRDVIVGVGTDIPVYLIAREGSTVVGAMPVFLFECELGNLMISIPQAGGYGGIVVERDYEGKEEVYAVLLSRLIQEAERYNCLLVTVSTPPFFGELSLYRRYFQPDFELENFFQYLDLQTDFPADLEYLQQEKLRENIVRNIKRAKKYGLCVVMNNDEEYFDRWYIIHQKRMIEIDGHPLPRSLFEGIRRYIVREGHGFLAYVLDEEKIIGGGVFVGLNQVIDYFMGSFDSEYAKKQPNSILMYEMLIQAQKQGYRYWNWQSCISRQSGVYHYKAGWGSREGLHYYLSKVVGDISELRKMPLSVIREKYRWHYVMPYKEFVTPSSALNAGGEYE